jgi:RNA polymerase sigma factor (sigma-70 family)
MLVQHDAFSALFFEHASRLMRLAALLGDTDPEDAVQESFCKVYAAWSKLDRPDADVVHYLNKVVVNEVRSRYRRTTTARRDAHLFIAANVADVNDSHGDRRVVLDALARLPPRQREALVLRYWLDLPMDRIAETMAVRPGTVRSQISRGLVTLAADLKETR